MTISSFIVAFLFGAFVGVVAHRKVRNDLNGHFLRHLRILSLGACSDATCPFLHITFDCQSNVTRAFSKVLYSEQHVAFEAVPHVLKFVRSGIESNGGSMPFLRSQAHLEREPEGTETEKPS